MNNFIIVGGGIVGLATAYAIKKANPESSILILEKEKEVASHQTGRNSGVIHSGVYYEPGSKKAELCTRGSNRMMSFCREFGIEYDQCGKVIVATSKEELPYLDILAKRGTKNGLKVQKISKSELNELEPHVNGIAALHVPEAGIVNYKKVAEALVEELKQRGVEISLNQHVTSIKTVDNQCYVETKGASFECDYVINCAGLYSDTLASKAGVDIQHRIIPFRGEYYELTEERRHLVKNLIYPVPNPSFPFLGVHFTRMIDGSIHAGPNAVLSLKREGYSKFSFDASEAWKSLSYPGLWKLAGQHWQEGFRELYRSFSKAEFVKSLQKLIPEVRAEDLVPSPAGVRAQALNPDGTLVDDFLIKYHGRSIHVCNAPSPAATASLEIGDSIAEYVMDHKSSKVLTA
ncbi:hydroxyglutarate oxidase [Aliifodinibius salipaludis]|uniref:Hydroxyglutarate oxidase n=1 Tax=Fodinibius salipaludis TaxID=2032627 RepID=A0A2A2GAX1_9BACT|nr:L-2-hydroxyglutarate oxidase [Aliifodinibius salipaludis]PAU94013.1 hydroxyglutarate oxidase [Aliifodinibius salipaludis]